MRSNTKIFAALIVSLLLLAVLVFRFSSAKEVKEASPFENIVSDINLEKFFDYKTVTLENGLRLVMHRDSSTPFVASAVYIHVGSKDEPQGKSGFAHLFEHLHFNGTPQNPGEYFEHLNEIGGSNANGTTDLDRTNYYQTVPKNSLERLLWLEADRLGNILDGIDKTKLQTQINVIKNEKNLSENSPFGTSSARAMSILFPKGHPYHHSTIGSIEDLESASIEDVKKWYNKYYGARNIVLSLAGDIDYAETEAMVRNHFAHLSSGPAITQDEKRHIIRQENTYHSVIDTSTSSQIVRSYILPPVIDVDDVVHGIAAEIMANGEGSYLYKALVNEQDLAKSITSIVRYNQLATIVHIYAVAADDVDLKDLAKAMDVATQDYLKSGPTQQDIDQVYGAEQAFLLENATSMATKAGMLAEAFMYNQNAHFDLKVLERIKTLNVDELKASAKQWLSSGYHDEYLIGKPEYTAKPISDESLQKPEIGPPPSLVMPKTHNFELKNGLKVVLVPRENSPALNMTLHVPVGWQNYTQEAQVVNRITHNMLLSAGHSNLTRDVIAAHKTKLGAIIEGSLGRSHRTYSLSTTLPQFRPSLSLWSQSLINPQFTQTDFQWAIRERRDVLKDASQSGRLAGPDIMNKKIFEGPLHLTYREQLRLLDEVKHDDIKAHHLKTLQPNKSTLFVVGDFTAETLKPLLETTFDNWTYKDAPYPKPVIASHEKRNAPLFMLINDAGSKQTHMTAKRVSDISFDEQNEAHNIANLVFGGGFTSRLNLNLREDKGWTYGIYSGVENGGKLAHTTINLAVPTHETLNAIEEIMLEITNLNNIRPILQNEVDDMTSPIIKSVALLVSDNFNIISTLVDNHIKKRPYNYQETSQARYQNLSADAVQAAAETLFQADDLVWTIVGDISQFEDDIREAGIGQVEVYDLEGNKLR